MPDTASPEARELVGVIVPFDMALDAEMWRWVPAGVELLFTRTPFSRLPVTVEMARTVGDAEVVEECSRDLVAVGPSVLAYGCTSGSFVKGVAGERELVAAMRRVSGGEAVTTSGALVAALARLTVYRVATATPYDEAVTDRLTAFLQEAGITVVSTAHLGLRGEIWKVPYRRTVELVRAADSPEADAIVVSCTNLATYDVIASLEDELGKPVVSANQATMWAILTRLGRRGVGPGQRLIELPD